MSQNGTETVSSPPDKAEITEAVHWELERILEHPLFAHSRRFPALLRYVVERALEGNTDHIKERSIGVIVFGRNPTYDTNADPIVRMTAGEIRKRLQQFYREPEHADDLRIVLPLGSYVPYFLNETSHASLEALAEIQPEERPPEAEPQSDELQVERRPPGIALSLRKLCMSVASVLLIACLSAWLGYRIHHFDDGSKALLRQVWSPEATPTPLLLCLPNISEKVPLSDAPLTHISQFPDTSTENRFGDHQAVARLDMLAATTVVRAVASTGRAVHIRLDYEINLDDLRDTPVVLIGAFDNPWSMRALQQAPYRFKLDLAGHTASIVDTRSPGTTHWSLDTNTPNLSISRDYAIVAHYVDSSTGQMTIVLAGIRDNGTEAAGELLGTEPGLTELSRWLKADLGNTNFEAVISTEVVAGKSGPPVIVAVAKW